MNPEFQRQLWLQFSPTRLAVMPVLLALILLVTYFTAEKSVAMALATAATVAFVISVFGVGAMAVGASVLDEVNDRTWDQQRMSAMQPWAMTWGKLLGASSYGWYGGLLALMAAIPCALATELRPLVFTLAAGALFFGLGLQALFMAVYLQRVKVDGNTSQRASLAVMVLVLLLAISNRFTTLLVGETEWWGVNMSTAKMALIDGLLLTVCAVFAAWRLMAEVLAVRQMPWGLTGFALVLALYTAGFADGRPATTTFGIAGLVICALLTYATLLAEPQRRTTWQKIFLRLQTGDFRAAFLQMPSWPGTLLLAFAFAIWCKFAIEATMSPNQLADAQTLGPLLWILLLTRDCAIALYFWFAPKSRRAGAALCLYLLLLYGLPFWLVRGIVDETLILVWILPGLGRGLLPWAVTLVHLGIALAMLRRRWLATDPARL